VSKEEGISHKGHKAHIERNLGFGELAVKLVLSEYEGTEATQITQQKRIEICTSGGNGRRLLCDLCALCGK
jgi:hypothetical protein